ncbi:hypothetical protein ACTWPB_27175 [Nocardia sp. IBHARD005]|uniref:hypothetical protein n=1 Tax=Nocardia sp. IBHARD005 TaxID=3457765 RepID=UPI004059DBD4
MTGEKYEIGGKIFEQSSESIDPDLLAEAQAALAKGDALRAKARARGELASEGLPERFHDDMVGTEYEGGAHAGYDRMCWARSAIVSQRA